jgi:uncharacterized protein
MLLLSIPLVGSTNDSRLADAAKSRDHAAVLSFLKEGVEVNSSQPDGARAIHWAAYWNDTKLVESLIRAGADVNVSNENGVTPLSLACTGGNTQVIDMLLEAGANPNTTIREGETPLMLAARAGNVTALKSLLAHGASINTKETWNGQTALMWAIAEGHVSAAAFLIENGADINIRSNSGFTALLFAVRQGGIDAVRLLLASGADVNGKRPDGATPLLVAVLNGNEDLVDLLLKNGAVPNVEGGSTEVTRPGVRAKPITIDLTKVKTQEEEDRAWRGGDIFHTDMVRQPDNVWGSPLHALVFTANPERSDIHWKIEVDKLRVARALMTHGANINAQSRSERPMFSGGRWHTQLIGSTPFLLAAKQSDLELMRLFLSRGADPSIAARNGTTALMVAAGLAWTPGQDSATESDALATVKFLVELGADVNAVNDTGETAMHGAAYRGANSIVQYLVEKGARIDVKDKRGWTPLTIAHGVEYGAGAWDQPQTAAFLRKLLAAGVK